MKEKTILLVGGGTGGHLIPVFEVYQKLKEQSNVRLLVLGSGSHIEKIFFNKNPDYHVIVTGKLQRSFLWKNIFEFFKVVISLFQVLFLFILQKPTVIFSKGGYVSFPIIFWAKIFRIPYILHESDIIMGLSNKYAADKAQKIFVGFPTEFYKKYNNLIFSGQIIKNEEESNTNPSAFGFTSSKPVILITGGSQGSRNINNNIIKIIPELLKTYNIIHQTGSSDYRQICEFKKQLDPVLLENYYVIDFLHNNEHNLMSKAINLSEVVVARAGANTIAELALKKKSMVLIPYKYASGDHQTQNANYLKKHESAVVLCDDELTSINLMSGIRLAHQNSSKFGNNAYNLFPTNGLDVVVSGILVQLKKG